MRHASPSDLVAIQNVLDSDPTGAAIDADAISAVRDRRSGSALSAGLRSGHDAMIERLAQRFFEHQFGDLTAIYQDTSLILVAEHISDGIVGVIWAGPPVETLLELVRHLKEQGKGRKDEVQLHLSAAMAITRIRSLSVIPSVRGHGIDTELLSQCLRIYRTAKFQIVFGSAASTVITDTVLRQAGFTVLEPNKGVDPWVVLGVSVALVAGPGSRVFVWPADTRVVTVPRWQEDGEPTTPATTPLGIVRVRAHEALTAAAEQPSAWAPHTAVLSLWHLHDPDCAISNFDTALTITEALRLLGVAAYPVPVVVAAKPLVNHKVAPPSLGSHRPSFRTGSYTGYLVVYLPAIGAFIDVSPIAVDFPDLLEPVSAPDALTDQPVKVKRGNFEIGYFPIEARSRDSWIRPDPAAEARHTEDALVLAAQAVEVLRWNGTSHPVDARYPLLEYLVRRAQDAPLVITNPDGCYFRSDDGTTMTLLDMRQTWNGADQSDGLPVQGTPSTA